MIKLDSSKFKAPFVYFEYYNNVPSATSIEQSISLPQEEVDYITIKSLGINQRRSSPVLDWQEEGNYRTDILVDVKNNTASGIITISTGQDTLAGSNYSFKNYDLSSGEMILSNAEILGDTIGRRTGNDQLGLGNLGLTLNDSQLVFTRDSLIARDFNEIYVVEMLQKTGLPYGGGFSLLSAFYLDPTQHSNASSGTDSSDFSFSYDIPDGSRKVTFLTTGNGIHDYSGRDSIALLNPQKNNGNYLNENQIITYASIDLINETHTGYNGFLATSSNQQLYAWKDVPLDVNFDYAKNGTITGQNPSSSDRVFWGLEDNKLLVKLRNSTWAMERNVLVRFEGSLPDLIPGEITQTTQKESCDFLYFEVELCNGGGPFLSSGEGINIHLMQGGADGSEIVKSYPVDVDLLPGKCKDYELAIDKNVIPKNAEKVWLQINGSAANSNISECLFNNNLESTFFRMPIVVEGNADVDGPVCRIPPGFIKEAIMDDLDNNGVADRLTINYERDLTIDGLPDQLILNWPNESSAISFTKDEIENAQVGKSQLVFERDFTGKPLNNVATVSSKKEDENFRTVEIKNNLSLYLTSAILSKDSMGVTDTLIIRLSEAPYEPTILKDAFYVNSELIDVYEIVKIDSLNWVLLLEHDKVSHGDKLELNDKIVRDEELDLVGYNPKVSVIEKGLILSLSNDRNLYLDTNEDGTMDKIQITLTDAIDTARILDWKIIVQWPDLSNELQEIEITKENWEKVYTDSLIYQIDVSDSSIVSMQTSLRNSESSIGQLLVDVDSVGIALDTIEFSMGDGMAPVPTYSKIIKTDVWDSVHVYYTEDVQMKDGIDSLYDFYSDGSYYYNNPYFFYDNKDQKNLVRLLHHNTENPFELYPGDSVKASAPPDHLNPITDLLGNSVTSKTKWTVLTGNVPLGEEINGLIIIDSKLNDSLENFSFELVEKSKTISQIKEESKYHGVFVEGSMLNLFDPEDLLKIDSLTLANLDPSEFVLTYQINVFSQIGQFVSQFSGKLKCDDDLFNGDCNDSDNENNIIINWNHKSEEGRQVGSGVYIIDYQLEAKVLDVRNTKEDRFLVGVKRE